MRLLPGRNGSRWVASPENSELHGLSVGRPVLVGASGSEASRRAVKAAVRATGGTSDVILVCATRRSRRDEAPTGLHDALKDESYLLTGQATVAEQLRTARELAFWLGARSVATYSDFGDPVTVLHHAADRFGAGTVVLGAAGGRPGWTARALRRRLDPGIDLVVTDGAVHHRRRFEARQPSTWGIGWALPEKGSRTALTT
ncbi:universal stress protein [Gordonia westfalica]|uniref:Universal stress protein family protein n=1 Tax=Gordonia westfalica TaxID=158898 RepID=A0A1H2IWA6_9ACTN|nr:universal stress protein [Gordonia westfalica]SDU48352.1 Universal stress protein family protein [Gordonia westfalica]